MANTTTTTTTPATDRCRISAAAINTPAGIVRHPGSTVNTPDVYNLSDAMVNDLLSNCPDDSNDSCSRLDALTQNTDRDSTEDIVRIQIVKEVFRYYLADEPPKSPDLGPILVSDSDGKADDSD